MGWELLYLRDAINLWDLLILASGAWVGVKTTTPESQALKCVEYGLWARFRA